MMATKILGGIKKIRSSINIRNFGSTPHNYCCTPPSNPCSNPPTPPGDGGSKDGQGGKGGECEWVKKMFLEKLQEYKSLSKDGKMVDPTKEILDELNMQLKVLAKKFNLNSNEDLTKFPNFVWKEPDIDPINLQEAKARDELRSKEQEEKKKAAEQEAKKKKAAEQDANKKK